jgi:hypothetical protein
MQEFKKGQKNNYFIKKKLKIAQNEKTLSQRLIDLNNIKL